MAMFPGQGSQSVGMGRQVLEEFPYTSAIFEEAEDATKLLIRKLCFEGPEGELRQTAHQQPAILTVSCAIWRVLSEEVGLDCSVVAGHSLGEYSALVASGRVQFGDAVALVRQRGKAMQDAVPDGEGAMAAVLGCDADKLVETCQQLANGQVCEVVNFNSPVQQIVSGDLQAVTRLTKVLAEQKIKSKMLPVSAPFHSSLMEPARKVMVSHLEQLKIGSSKVPVVANLTGELVHDYRAQLLIDQVSKPVLWTKSMAAAYEHGARRYLEIGPGKVLFGLARRCLPRDVSISHTDDVVDAIKSLSQKN